MEIVFTLHERPDSVKQPNYSDFYIVRGPNYSSLSSSSNGVMKSTQTTSYVLKPKKSGDFRLFSPVFYFKGNDRFEIFQITVKDKTLPTEALKKIQNEKEEKSKLENFKKQILKENGTVQITINGDMGYIKIWKNGKEENYKDLTESEIKTIRNKLKIKK